MVALIGYAAVAAAFLWICWQVAGAYADYQERGEALEEQDELVDALIREIRDLEEANRLLAADNREQAARFTRPGTATNSYGRR